MVLSDGSSAFEYVRRCDDVIDHILVSYNLTEAAVLKGIRKLTAIKPVKMKAALRKDGGQGNFSNFFESMDGSEDYFTSRIRTFIVG